MPQGARHVDQRVGPKAWPAAAGCWAAGEQIKDASEAAASLAGVPNIKQQGTRQGNWLTRAQAKELLEVPDSGSREVD
jgi:hypothetical protein